MKKIINILSLVAVAAFTLVSCQKEAEKHEPGPQETAGCYGVYFPVQAASGSHIYSPVEDPSIDIVLARTNTSGSITVPIVTSFSENVFTVGAATFADGQDETVFTVRFDNAQEGVTYKASFVIEDNQYASLYNSNAIGLDFDVMRVEMKDFLNPVTGEPAVITLNEGWWGEVHKAQMEYYEVNGIRTCTIYSIEEGGIWGDSVNATLQFNWYTKENNDAGYNFLEVQKQYFGFDYADWASKPEGEAANPIYVYDYPWYWIEIGYSWGAGGMGANWLEEAKLTGQIDGSYPVGYYDGNGGFYFNLRYYIPGLGGFSKNPYEFVAIADGFTRVDYSLALESDFTVDGVTPISVEAGADVAKIQYAVYEGELTPTQIGNKVSAIVSGTDASETFSDFEYDEEEGVYYSVLGVTPETTGTYTLVAVAYDESGKDQNSAGVSFIHIAADDTEEYAVDISAFTEATPERYKDFTEYDSFAFGILGSGITEAHVAIVESSNVSENFLAALKLDAKGTYTVSDDILEKINGVGGYYDVVGNLDPGTEYAVVVWATNGFEDALAASLYSTTALPEVWKPIGKGQYIDDFFTTFFNVSPQTMEVEFAQSEDDPTRFKMIYPYDGKYPYNEEGDYDTSKSYDIVFTIPDANHVYITPQKIGVDWGYGMFSIASMAGYNVAAGYSVEEIAEAGIPFGVLNDGVVTFPDEAGHSLLISMAGYNNGAWYYANSNDACKIVLPEGVTAAAQPAVQQSKPAGMTARTLNAAPQVKHVFERDPKPVKVQVNVSHERKAKTVNRTITPAKDVRAN